MWSDPVVTRFIGGKPSSPQQTWARLLGYLGHWSVLDFGYWAIEEKSSASFVGEIGFADFKRAIAPSMRDVPELGFALASHAHGKGYATEAARAVVAWGDENLPSARTVCLIDPLTPRRFASHRTAGTASSNAPSFTESRCSFCSENGPRRVDETPNTKASPLSERMRRR